MEDSRKYKEMVAWLEGKVKDRQGCVPFLTYTVQCYFTIKVKFSSRVSSCLNKVSAHSTSVQLNAVDNVDPDKSAS